MTFGQKAMFSMMDLKDAFHQGPLHPESRPLTCTSTPLEMCGHGAQELSGHVLEGGQMEVGDVAGMNVDDIVIETP